MKIVIIGPVYPLRGGIAHHTTSLYYSLKKEHDVSIINFKLQYPKIFFPGKSQEENIGSIINIESKKLINSISPLSWILTAIHLIKLRPDLVIFSYWMSFFAPCYGTISLFTKLFCRAKIFFMCHNIIPHEKFFANLILVKFAFKFADGCIVQADAVQKDLLSLFPKKKYINIPHPVYTFFGDLYSKEYAKNLLNLSDERTILFFGYIRSYKGLSVLISAMPFVLEKIKLKLLIVGEFYDDYDRYIEQIKLLRLENDIKIISEYVPNEEVVKYFSATDIVILPYITASQSGIVQLAYNFNKPVIVSDVGGLAEVVSDNKTGFIVRPQSPRDLASAVIRYYTENKESEFAKNVEEEKKKYSWERMVEGIKELYDRIK